MGLFRLADLLSAIARGDDVDPYELDRAERQAEADLNEIFEERRAARCAGTWEEWI